MQRVVDRDAEPDQRDQELHDRRDVGDLREPVDGQERGHDRRDRHQQRHEREQRAEHEGEHEQRAEAADQRLEEHARAVAAAASGCASASKPDRCTGAPATVAPCSAARSFFSAFGLSPNGWSGSGGG